MKYSENSYHMAKLLNVKCVELVDRFANIANMQHINILRLYLDQLNKTKHLVKEFSLKNARIIFNLIETFQQ